jgi:D-alanine-D-alanine ligase-like ATP-grasp enzyme
MSNEAEVSIDSAKNIVKHFDHKKYTLVLIYWAKDGNFYVVNDIERLDERKSIAIEDFHKTFDIALLMTHGKY